MSALFSVPLSHLLVLVMACVGCVPVGQADTIHGTTILNWPYVSRLPNGQFEGFCVDLLNELSKLMGMAYTLRVVSDGQYGGWVAKNGSINGMVGEVMRGEADFAIGDITVLSTRARFVDFTAPFLEFGLSALARREVLQHANVRSFKDLSEQTALAYGVKKYGANLPLFHASPVVAKMYSYMDTHPSVFVSGEREGVLKVKRDRYAFIAESPFVEYVVQRDCDLAAIDDRRKHFQYEYAIAVPLNSPLKAKFSKAIKQLKKSGRIQELKDKYWLVPGGPKCDSNSQSHNNDNGGQRPTNNDNGGDKINFSDRNRLNPNSQDDDLGRQKSVNQVDAKVVSEQNDQYRGPHDEVDEEEIELIRPREQENRNKRRRKRVKNDGSREHASHLTMILVLALLATSLTFVH